MLPTKIFPVAAYVPSRVVAVESSSSDDEDDDQTNTTTTTTESLASTSSKRSVGHAGTTPPTTTTKLDSKLSGAAGKPSSLTAHKSPPKIDKKIKTEIKSTLLADWSDHYTSEDDDDDNENNSEMKALPVKLPPISIQVQEAPIDKPTEIKPKYRNIPKKDRRAEVLREFYTDVVSVPPITTTSEVITSVAAKKELNVIVLDSDDSDGDKLSIQMEEITRGSSVDSKPEPIVVVAAAAVVPDAIKPIKKRDIGRQQLEIVNDGINDNVASVIVDNAAVSAATTATDTEKIEVSNKSVDSTMPTRVRGRKKDDKPPRPVSRRSGRIKGHENGT